MGYEIPNPPLDRDFVEAFKVAGMHIQSMAKRCGVQITWLRAVPYGPSIEHLSFFCKNQVYFVQALDNSGEKIFPGGSEQGMRRIAKAWGGVACWMPLRRAAKKGLPPWQPVIPNWGLISVDDEELVDPVEMGLAEPPVATDWELHDFAVQFVREKLQEGGVDVLSWNSDPDVMPSIWISGNDGPEWVVVGECREPETDVKKPEGLREQLRQLREQGCRGWWAPVVFRALTKKPGRPELIYRGEGADADFAGLQPLDF